MASLARIRDAYIDEGLSYAQAEARTAQDAMLGDSDEQVVAEKLRSLLRIGAASTRYKDVFDIYYLFIVKGVRKEALSRALHALVIDDAAMREANYGQIAARLKSVFGNRRFSNQLMRAKNDWLGVPHEKATSAIVRYFEQEAKNLKG
ncbi:nucleotidyl transferase AbiEii/AbiGii toxin family protein [Adlercreutzia sp. R7]|uniref:Nucleotidyl transferase AbiEii/AbiGii toxin family protein n=1 Tax=Adlercreutzia wanghongyangiae TaxID=3111451 RepID=A0ABU6IF01_9ACTN|nr:nucleotidyl transferase AbiEii/AbiGii toxin family protein [Adlercreutzia sp. R7]